MSNAKQPPPENFDENPAWTRDDFAKARPLCDTHPELATWSAEQKRKRGQRGPQKAPTKVAKTLRIDQDVLQSYRAEGKGWQAIMNADLRKARGLPPRQ